MLFRNSVFSCVLISLMSGSLLAEDIGVKDLGWDKVDSKTFSSGLKDSTKKLKEMGLDMSDSTVSENISEGLSEFGSTKPKLDDKIMSKLESTDLENTEDQKVSKKLAEDDSYDIIKEHEGKKLNTKRKLTETEGKACTALMCLASYFETGEMDKACGGGVRTFLLETAPEVLRSISNNDIFYNLRYFHLKRCPIEEENKYEKYRGIKNVEVPPVVLNTNLINLPFTELDLKEFEPASCYYARCQIDPTTKWEVTFTDDLRGTRTIKNCADAHTVRKDFINAGSAGKNPYVKRISGSSFWSFVQRSWAVREFDTACPLYKPITQFQFYNIIRQEPHNDKIMQQKKNIEDTTDRVRDEFVKVMKNPNSTDKQKVEAYRTLEAQATEEWYFKAFNKFKFHNDDIFTKEVKGLWEDFLKTSAKENGNVRRK